jgi:hypothetical protein
MLSKLRASTSGPLNGRNILDGHGLWERSECPAASNPSDESLNPMVVDGKLFLPDASLASSSGLKPSSVSRVAARCVSAGPLTLSASSGMYSDASSFSFWTCCAHLVCVLRLTFLDLPCLVPPLPPADASGRHAIADIGKGLQREFVTSSCV